MTLETALRAHPPKALAPARAFAHQAVQLATRAARANLPAVADDSHSNLGWERGGLFSQPITRPDGDWRVGVVLGSLSLEVMRGDSVVAETALDGLSISEASAWLDAKLAGAGLAPGGPVALPYDLPPDVAAVARFQQADGLTALEAWFALADELLSGFASKNAVLAPGPSPVRCWPHHFDIATYVALETGDAETARGVGVGLSPGDESFDQPYFYVNPWPHLDPTGLPAAPAPGRWMTEGFVGVIATGEEALSLRDPLSGMATFLDGAFAIGRERLGI